MEKVQLSDFLGYFTEPKSRKGRAFSGDWPNIGLTDLHY